MGDSGFWRLCKGSTDLALFGWSHPVVFGLGSLLGIPENDGCDSLDLCRLFDHSSWKPLPCLLSTRGHTLVFWGALHSSSMVDRVLVVLVLLFVFSLSPCSRSSGNLVPLCLWLGIHLPDDGMPDRCVPFWWRARKVVSFAHDCLHQVQ